MSRIIIVEENPTLSDCLQRAAAQADPEAEILCFRDAISAMAALSDTLPSLIILNVFPSGPDGFTFLNELISYHDTAQIPILLIATINLQQYDLKQYDLKHYGVVDTLYIEEITPQSTKLAIQKALDRHQERNYAK